VNKILLINDNNMDNKFKKGLILGGLLAVGAAIGFFMTKSGQELSEDLQKDLKTLAKRLQKNLSKLDDVTKENFDNLVDAIVTEYSDKKQLANDTKDTITQLLQAKWLEMEAEYLDEQAEHELSKE
jgi:BMFP domain-containing protein YqiC